MNTRKTDLGFEILIVAFVSTVMVMIRYNDAFAPGHWNPGWLDLLGIVAICHPAVSREGALVVFWLLRFGISCVAAGILFWTLRSGRLLNYTLVAAASFCINMLMGLGSGCLGE